MRPARPAAAPPRRPARSTARWTRRSTSTPASSRRCTSALGQAAISPRPMWSPTKSATMSRTNLASFPRQRDPPAGQRGGIERDLGPDRAAGRLPVGHLGPRGGADPWRPSRRGDLEEAVNAAKQIGDDTLQRNAGQRPMPHTFTHGTSEQRSRWFMIGLAVRPAGRLRHLPGRRSLTAAPALTRAWVWFKRRSVARVVEW
jgi:hypothetical protein